MMNSSNKIPPNNKIELIIILFIAVHELQNGKIMIERLLQTF